MKKRVIQRALSVIYLVVIVLFILSLFNKGILPDMNEIYPDLLKNPIQKMIEVKEFTVDYMGKTYSIIPVADYELWGLVVSHNKTPFVFDIYHDKTSFDTKDISVIWGRNLKGDDYKKVEYWSGPWSGRRKIEVGVTHYRDDYSNNHLVTSNGYVRGEIADIQIGDQLHIKGLLVNYKRLGWADNYYRKSSTSRKDKGNGACEVIFVNDMEILRKCTPGWYSIYSTTIRLLLIIPIIKLILFFVLPNDGRKEETLKRREELEGLTLEKRKRYDLGIRGMGDK